MARQSGNPRTYSRLRSIWTVTISSGATDRFRQYSVVARRNSAKLPQLGSRIGCSIESCLRAEKEVSTLSYALSVTLHGHSAHCPLCRRKACAMVSRISSNVYFARFERLTYDLEEYRLENIFQLLNDAFRHLVFTSREHEDVVLMMELLNGTAFQRRVSDLGQATVSSFTSGD